MEIPEYIGVEALAAATKASKRAVYAWIAAGTAPTVYRVGKRVLFRADEAARWIESHREEK
jgi:excisionase family DNA binding protein